MQIYTDLHRYTHIYTDIYRYTQIYAQKHRVTDTKSQINKKKKRNESGKLNRAINLTKNISSVSPTPPTSNITPVLNCLSFCSLSQLDSYVMVYTVHNALFMWTFNHCWFRGFNLLLIIPDVSISLYLTWNKVANILFQNNTANFNTKQWWKWHKSVTSKWNQLK